MLGTMWFTWRPLLTPLTKYNWNEWICTTNNVALEGYGYQELRLLWNGFSLTRVKQPRWADRWGEDELRMGGGRGRWWIPLAASAPTAELGSAQHLTNFLLQISSSRRDAHGNCGGAALQIWEKNGWNKGWTMGRVERSLSWPQQVI